MTENLQDGSSDLRPLVAELEQKLQAGLAERDDALAQQEATSEVLEVINASPGALAPVFDTIVEKAARLCDAYGGGLWLVEGGLARATGGRGGNMPEPYFQYVSHEPVPVKHLLGHDGQDRPFLHVVDLKATKSYQNGIPFLVASVDLGGVRTSLSVPLKDGGAVIGVFIVIRQEVRPFSDKQIALVRRFAAQAQIAMKNARLMHETRRSLERQTATSDILKIVASSPSNEQPVFHAIVLTAVRLLGCDAAFVLRCDGATFSPMAAAEPQGPLSDLGPTNVPIDPSANFPSRAIVAKKNLHVPDWSLVDVPKHERHLHEALGVSSALYLPLLRGEECIGVIALAGKHANIFGDTEIALAESFRDQALIAIENARLFNEVEARTKELAASLDELRTAQDRLVQTDKLAALGQLTAGIAHEIKNPLNFVNNFSALSAELIDELSDVLKPAAVSERIRSEVDELTLMLKDNLQKVVQHGKRADSIVKNMLQHSREGSGEHRAADINAIVDESLNLAYHGARAEKTGFSVALQRDLDPSVGMADVYPQEITRVLLNLISNGFYAATKRKAEAGDGFEPMLSASTKNLGDKVEIRVRDNGTGIPEEVKEKIFNPFFTTKPSGEGTGLGLSMSHDIIVKQHGGSIDLETKPGLFTEFKIVLPRTGQR